MSTVELTNRSDRPEPTLRGVDPAQRAAARLAGFLYLFTNITAGLAFYVRSQLMVRGDAVQTARNFAASERSLRIAIVTELVTVACVLMLVAALYVVLKPISNGVALVAAFWRLSENFVLAVITLSEFAALALLNADSANAFDTKQLQALWHTLFRVYGAGFNVGFVFLGLGSTVFSYLWFKSRYIPRVLAAWGIFSSLVLAIFSLAIMVSPGLAGVVGMAYMGPMGLYEMGLGLWLLVKGLRVSIAE